MTKLETQMNSVLDIEEIDKHLYGLELEIAAFINTYMVENNISYRQLSKEKGESGMSKSQIGYYLSCKSDNNLGRLLLIAKYLGLSGKISIDLSAPLSKDNKNEL